jgi:hypothetical protein
VGIFIGNNFYKKRANLKKFLEKIFMGGLRNSKKIRGKFFMEKKNIYREEYEEVCNKYEGYMLAGLYSEYIRD